ncbi:hypothetical protein AVEN_212341-1, partial [Araneus ventricosus]
MSSRWRGLEVLKGRMQVEVSSSSSEHGLKLLGPFPNSLRFASRDVNA